MKLRVLESSSLVRREEKQWFCFITFTFTEYILLNYYDDDDDVMVDEL
jgi:hypothetical protein